MSTLVIKESPDSYFAQVIIIVFSADVVARAALSNFKTALTMSKPTLTGIWNTGGTFTIKVVIKFTMYTDNTKTNRHGVEISGEIEHWVSFRPLDAPDLNDYGVQLVALGGRKTNLPFIEILKIVVTLAIQKLEFANHNSRMSLKTVEVVKISPCPVKLYRNFLGLQILL